MHRFDEDDEEDDLVDDNFDEDDDEDDDFDADEDAELDEDDLLDEDEEAEDELLASGAQRCPLCGRRGSPDDLESCEHFHAVVWDDEVLIGGDDLNPAWEELQDLWAEHDDIFIDQFADELEEKLVGAAAGVQRVVRDGLMDENPLFWAEDGETVDRERAGGGDPSGSGFAVYHRNPAFMERLVSNVLRTRGWLKKFARTRLENDPD